MKARGRGGRGGQRLRVEGHSSDRDRANRGGKFARARLEWRGDEFAAIRENRKFNLRVPPLDKNSLAPLDTLPSTSIRIEIRMSSTRWGVLVGNGISGTSTGWEFRTHPSKHLSTAPADCSHPFPFLYSLKKIYISPTHDLYLCIRYQSIDRGIIFVTHVGYV